MNTSIHVRDLDALKRFAQSLTAYDARTLHSVKELAVFVAEAEACVARAVADVEQRVESAQREVNDCESALYYCEAQEDDDYIPDCSCERSALYAAERDLAMWQRRRDVLLTEQRLVSERSSQILELVESFSGAHEAVTARGRVFLAAHIQRLTELAF